LLRLFASLLRIGRSGGGKRFLSDRSIHTLTLAAATAGSYDVLGGFGSGESFVPWVGMRVGRMGADRASRS